MEDSISSTIQQIILSLMLEGETKACFSYCITKPGTELSANEKQCLSMCQDRYQEVFQKTFFRQYERFLNSKEEHQQSQ